MTAPEKGDFKFLRFKPRHWKKRDVCRRRNCRKRRVHWHWIATTQRLGKILKEVYEKPLIAAINAPNPLLALIGGGSIKLVGRTGDKMKMMLVALVVLLNGCSEYRCGIVQTAKPANCLGPCQELKLLTSQFSWMARVAGSQFEKDDMVCGQYDGEILRVQPPR